MVEPISTTLAGIALVQKSVDFIKSNLNTVNDIKDIAGAIDSLFEGEKQVQKQRFNDKSIIGQTKDAANSVIDAKLAQEQLEEMSILIDNRFGYGTWRQIVAERAKRIQQEKEAVKEQKRKEQIRKQRIKKELKTAGIAFGSIIGFTALVIIFLLVFIVEAN